MNQKIEGDQRFNRNGKNNNFGRSATMATRTHVSSDTMLTRGSSALSLCLVQSKSTIEPCNSSDSCPSLLSYLLPWDSKLSEIATRFNVNFSDILASNSIFPITPSSAHQILSAKSLVKIPISCSCVEGYGGLVSTLVIPLPCTCFDNVNDGGSAIYMSCVVQRRESLGSIATKFGTTASNLESVNGFGEATRETLVSCSSATLNWYDESMIVPNASYTLTATNCIKCTCEPTDITLQCVPSGFDVPCYNLRCKGSNLIIACNVSQCVYRGHRGGKILSS
ncbi:hypothetical protein AAZX31_05G218500 [Glycine max]